MTSVSLFFYSLRPLSLGHSVFSSQFPLTFIQILVWFVIMANLRHRSLIGQRMGVAPLCIDECSDNWLRELGVVSGHFNRNGSFLLSSWLLKCHFNTVIPLPFNCSPTLRALTWLCWSIISWCACRVCVCVWENFRKVVHLELSYRRYTQTGSCVGGGMFLNHTAITPEGMHMEDNLTLSLRGSGEERGFVMGVAVWLWGSMGLSSRGWGLWSRKRHRQEVRAG